MRSALFEQGWAQFPHDPDLLRWVADALPFARAATRDQDQITHWLRYGKTWFVGVNALPNDGEGQLPGGRPLTDKIRQAVTTVYDWYPLDRGQVSIMYPGYPKQDPGETDAAHRFRKKRDAAHLDGIKPDLPGGRRCVDETHAYILGIPLNSCGEGASPLVVWEGSHHIMRRAFTQAFKGVPAAEMRRHDITEIYRAARAEVFETCPRIEVTAQPGESYLLHRFTLHGVAPWKEGAVAPKEGRMVAYFRPELPGGVADWLHLP